MLNALNARTSRSNQVVWPPDAMAAQLAYGSSSHYAESSGRRSLLHWSFSLPLAAALLFSGFIGFVLVYYRDLVAQMGEWGYVGVFFIEMANSATIFIPTPGQTYAFALGITLNPFLLGIIGGTGSALGELTGYILGARAGHRISHGRTFMRLQGLTMKWGGICLFLFALLPGPFEVAGLWAGTVRYPIWRFLLYVALGKMLKVTAFAAAGYFSISWLLTK